MNVDLDTLLNELTPEHRKRVEERTAQLIAEEMTLRALRKARKRTQVQLAKKLGVTQDSVSRMEQRSDLLLSTLRKTVEAMGGHLSLVAAFPDQPPVVLSGFADPDNAPPKKKGKRRSRTAARS